MPLNEKARPLQFQVLSRGLMRSLLVAAVLCTASYYHVNTLLEDSLKAQLTQYISERGRSDSAPFLQVEKHHIAFETAFVEQYSALAKGETTARFEDYFKAWPDGTHRTRESWFEGHQALDGLSHGGFSGFIGKEVTLSPEFKQRAALMAGLLDWYGTVWTSTGQYIDYFVSAPENILIGEFVGLPYLHQVPSDTYFPDEIFVAPANQANNPERKTVWTHFYFDQTAQVWLVSALRPVYFKDQHLATAGQDILLDQFMQRVLFDRFQDTQNIAFDHTGNIIAYEPLMADIKESGGTLNVMASSPELQEIYRRVTERQEAKGVIETEVHYLSFSRIDGPGWFLVNIYPKSLLQQHGRTAALVILGIALAGLILEFFLLFGIVRTHVIRPLRFLMERSQLLGDNHFTAFDAEPEPSTCQEIRALHLTVRAVSHQLDAMLRAERNLNDNLDQLVRERTQKLEEANTKLSELAITDVLSGLFNRRYYEHYIPHELKKAARIQQTPMIAVMMLIDLDNFKQINDQYGHQAGDNAITAVSEVIRQLHQRASEACFRIGGDEFAVFSLREDDNQKSLQDPVEALLEAARNLRVRVRDAQEFLHVSLSIGCYATHTTSQTSLEHLYKNADRCLLKAKAVGKNCAVLCMRSLTQSGGEVIETVVGKH